MSRTIRSILARTVAVAAVGLAGALTLAACTGGTNVIAPVIADLNTIDGTTVEVTKGNVIDLTGDDKTFTAWSATIEDDQIVSFTPGKDDGSAQFNPDLEALTQGTTEVTLDNAESGDTVTFTVEVTPTQ